MSNLISYFHRFSLLFIVSLFAPSGQTQTPNLTLSCQNLPDMMRAFLSRHIMNQKLDDKIKERTVSQMLKILDSTKMLFLKSEVEELKKALNTLFVSAAKNDCSPLSRAQAKVIQKTEELETIVKTFVNSKDYKLDENAELILDSDKREIGRAHV